jgi:hypothetical protein
MNAIATKKSSKGKNAYSAAGQKPSPKRGARSPSVKPAGAAQLRAQTRKLLGKHYRAKYGVR